VYADALEQVRVSNPNTWFPADNPFALEQLLAEDWAALLNRLPRSA
jgi:hypothetical protein